MTTITNNPILDWNERPAYDEITAEHVEPAVNSVIANAEQRLHDIEQDPPITWQGLFPKLEIMGDEINRVWGLINHINAVSNSPEHREAYKQVQPKLIELTNKINQSQEIYKSATIIKESEQDQLDTTQQRVLDDAIRSAKLAGIGLEGDKQTRFNEISTRLAELSMKFGNNLLDATKAYSKTLTTSAETVGLPASFLAMAAESARQNGHESATAEQGPWVITLDWS